MDVTFSLRELHWVHSLTSVPFSPILVNNRGYPRGPLTHQWRKARRLYMAAYWHTSQAWMEYRVKIHTMSRVRLKISWTAVELRSAVAACSYMLPRHSWALEIHSPEADQLGAPSQGRRIRYQVSTCEDDVRLKRVAKLMRYPYSTNWVEFFDCRSRIALSAYE